MTMDDPSSHFLSDLIGRLTGPLTFRIILQPTMAIFYAIRDGRRDAREGKPPYFWGLFTRPAERATMLRDGWKAIVRVIVLGIVMDVIYQFIVLRWVYPVQMMVVVLVLVVLPYVLLRGPINRLTAPPGPPGER